MKTNWRRGWRAGFSWRWRLRRRAVGKRVDRRRERAWARGRLRVGDVEALGTRLRRDDNEGRLGVGLAEALAHPRCYASFLAW